MMRVSGEVGALRVGYQVAARLGKWTLSLTAPGAATLIAAILDEDPYWIEQQPLSLVLRVGRTEWAWSTPPLSRTGGQVEAQLNSWPDVRDIT